MSVYQRVGLFPQMFRSQSHFRQSFEEDIEKVTADQQKATKAVQSHQSQSYDFMDRNSGIVPF